MAIVTRFGIGATIMRKPAEELIIQSILDEFAASHQSREELEAKALFRLLNYCPPSLETRMTPHLTPREQAFQEPGD
jgi:hypothetical protein